MADGIFIKEKIDHLSVDGVSVRYVKAGKENGVPLLLTAPWPESIFAFNLVWSDLCKLGPVIAVDLPGFGQSQAREDLMSPDAMGNFVIKLMAAFGIERAHVIAPDVGTLAALFAASKRPDLFESIVAGSGGASMSLLGESLAQVVASKKAAYVGSDGGEQVVKFVSGSARVTIPTEILEDYRLSSEGQRWNEAADFVRAYSTDLPRLEKLLPDIQTPVLVISGKDDPLVPPSNGDFLAGLLPHSRAEIVEAGHFVWEDASADYARLVSSWIMDGYRSV